MLLARGRELVAPCQKCTEHVLDSNQPTQFVAHCFFDQIALRRYLLESVCGGSIQLAHEGRCRWNGGQGRERDATFGRRFFKGPSDQVPSVFEHRPRVGKPHGRHDERVRDVYRDRQGVLARLGRAQGPVSFVLVGHMLEGCPTSFVKTGYNTVPLSLVSVDVLRMYRITTDKGPIRL